MKEGVIGSKLAATALQPAHIRGCEYKNKTKTFIQLHVHNIIQYITYNITYIYTI